MDAPPDTAVGTGSLHAAGFRAQRVRGSPTGRSGRDPDFWPTIRHRGAAASSGAPATKGQRPKAAQNDPVAKPRAVVESAIRGNRSSRTSIAILPCMRASEAPRQ